MKALGISGSPRVKSNTDLLLARALDALAEAGADTETILTDKLKIEPCREYNGCKRDGNCVIRDEMDDIYPKLLDADVVIVASPVFFYSVSAQAKALIDRCQALWARRYILKQQVGRPGRKGAFIGVGATHGDKLFDGSLLIMKYFCQALDIEFAEQLLVRGVDGRAEIKQHPDQLDAAYEMGKRLASASSN